MYYWKPEKKKKQTTIKKPCMVGKVANSPAEHLTWVRWTDYYIYYFSSQKNAMVDELALLQKFILFITLSQT